MNAHADSGIGPRRLWQGDMPSLREHLARLDPESRFHRFGMAATDEFVERYAERCFGIDDVIYGWFDAEGRVRAAGELRGMCRSLASGDGGSAEAAFTVERGWRRKGVGTALMSRIVRDARNRRTETLYMAYLARNVAMQRLARKFEAEMRVEPERRGRGRFRWPLARWRDAFGDAGVHATAVLDLQRRAYAMRRV